jgi:glycerophosphoryl diester phosphodiesterase
MVRTAAGKAEGVAWVPNFGSLSPELIKQAQGLALQAIPGTVDHSSEIERLIDGGVDGIVTDAPDRLRAVTVQMGLHLPNCVSN